MVVGISVVVVSISVVVVVGISVVVVVTISVVVVGISVVVVVGISVVVVVTISVVVVGNSVVVVGNSVVDVVVVGSKSESYKTYILDLFKKLCVYKSKLHVYIYEESCWNRPFPDDVTYVTTHSDHSLVGVITVLDEGTT